MTAKPQVSKWITLTRRLFGRPTPYWRKRLEDEQEPAPMLEAGKQVGFQVIFAMVLGIAVLLPAAYLSQLAFVAPGGLPGVIGAQLADVCRSTGRCNFGELMAGFAFAVDFVIVSIVYLVLTVNRAIVIGASASGSEQDMAYLDARIVSLRNELVTSGIITLPAEERKDES